VNPSRTALLAEMGFSPVWVRRETPPVARRTESVEMQPPAAGNPAPPDARPAAPREKAGAGTADRGGAGMGWEELRQTILECRACGLCAQRKQAVPGVGDENAAWLFIGEGPGAEEDARGEPFVGPAGRLLDAMLAAIGLKRGEDVYIANTVKCRPPGNRDPENAEMAACFPYLKRQIALIRPRLIVLLGRKAANAMLGEERSLASLRGRKLNYRDGDLEVPMLATYHPAYLLRNPSDKAKSWEDLCRARTLMRELNEPESPG
jgi:DNA polymerase